MNDLISREDALNFRVSRGLQEDGIVYVPMKEVKNYLRGLPSAQPEKCEDCGNFNKTRLVIPQPEQKKAKWKKSDLFEGLLSCSHCGTQRNPKFNLGLGSWNYCPNCGFKTEVEG